MTVQELIDKLEKVEDKNLEVVDGDYQYISDIEIGEKVHGKEVVVLI